MSEVVRFCLKDGSSILGVIESKEQLDKDLEEKQFIHYKNTKSQKIERLNVDSISIVRDSERDEFGNRPNNEILSNDVLAAVIKIHLKDRFHRKDLFSDNEFEHGKAVAYGRLLRDARLFNVLKIRLNEKELAELE